jgi:hypothetical protein
MYHDAILRAALTSYHERAHGMVLISELLALLYFRAGIHDAILRAASWNRTMDHYFRACFHDAILRAALTIYHERAHGMEVPSNNTSERALLSSTCTFNVSQRYP